LAGEHPDVISRRVAIRLVLDLGDAKTAESLAEMYGDIYIRAPPHSKMKASPPARITLSIVLGVFALTANLPRYM
jgi:hypothetical protein